MLPPPRGPPGRPASGSMPANNSPSAHRGACAPSQGSRQGIHQVTAAFPDPGTYRPEASASRGLGSYAPAAPCCSTACSVCPEGGRCVSMRQSAAWSKDCERGLARSSRTDFVAAATQGCTGTLQNSRKHPDNKKPRKSEVLSFVLGCCRTVQWCPREDSNLHGFTRQYLKLVRLPIPPPGQSGRAFSR